MKKQIRSDLLYIALLAGVVFLFISKLPLGMAPADECFYPTIPYRMALFDEAFFVHEWNLAQLSGFILYPFMKIYLSIFKSTEGIILAARYLYLAMHLITGTCVYILLRKKYNIAAVGASIIYLMFVPYGIMAPCYNSMGLMFVLLFAVIIVSNEKISPPKGYFSGICLALAVLCNPYLLALYVLFAVISLCTFKKKDNIFNIKSLIFITLGAATILAIFLAFLLSRATIPEILQNLPYCLSDGSHESKGIRTAIWPVLKFIREYIWFFALYFISLLAGIFKKQLKNAVILFQLALCVFLSGYFSLMLTREIGYNAVMMSLSLVGFSAYIFTENKSKELLVGWAVGVVFAMCAHLASNQEMYVITSALTVSTCISILILYSYAKENKSAIKYAGIAAVCLQLVFQGYVFVNHIFRDEAIPSLDTVISEGPLKGIITTEERAEQYLLNYRNIRTLLKENGSKILCINDVPYCYLAEYGKEIGSYSAWTTNGDFIDKATAYYDLHPDKIPDIIYVAPGYAWEAEALFDRENICLEAEYHLAELTNGAYGLIKNQN